MTRVIEVIGSPGAGKTTLLEALEVRWDSDPQVSLHTFSSIEGKRRPGFLPAEAVTELGERIDSLIPTRVLSRPQTTHWANRLKTEMNLSCRHFDMFAKSPNLLHLSDSRIWGKLFLELADPRNPLGYDILPQLIEIYRSYTKVCPQHLVLLSCPARVAYKRTKGRTTNIVRKDLGSWARRRFFRQAENLLSDLPGLISSVAPEVSFTILDSNDSPIEGLAPQLDSVIQAGKDQLAPPHCSTVEE